MVVTLKALSTSVIEEDPREQGFSSRQSHTEANAQMPGRMWPAEVASPFWTPVVPTGLSALWERSDHSRHEKDTGHRAEQAGSLSVFTSLHLHQVTKNFFLFVALSLLLANYQVNAKA